MFRYQIESGTAMEIFDGMFTNANFTFYNIILNVKNIIKPSNHQKSPWPYDVLLNCLPTNTLIIRCVNKTQCFSKSEADWTAFFYVS